MIKEKMNEVETIETPMLYVAFRPDGITYVKPVPMHHSTLADSIESFEMIKKVNKGKPALILNDFRDSRNISVDKEARDYTANPEVAKNIRAFAVLVLSPSGKAFGNLWMKLSKPPYPTRLFRMEDDAVAWLEEFMD